MKIRGKGRGGNQERQRLPPAAAGALIAAAGVLRGGPLFPPVSGPKQKHFVFTAEELAELSSLHGKAKKKRVEELKEKYRQK